MDSKVVRYNFKKILIYFLIEFLLILLVRLDLRDGGGSFKNSSLHDSNEVFSDSIGVKGCLNRD